MSPYHRSRVGDVSLSRAWRKIGLRVRVTREQENAIEGCDAKPAATSLSVNLLTEFFESEI